MKIFTIIGGVNGCGKSSLTGSLKAERTDLGIIVDPDKLTAEMGGDEYEGGKLAVDKLERALTDGVSFTQEDDALRRIYAQTGAPRQGCRVLYSLVLPRLGHRTGKPGLESKTVCAKAGTIFHGVTLKTVSSADLKISRRFFRIATKRVSLITITALC